MVAESVRKSVERGFICALLALTVVSLAAPGEELVSICYDMFDHSDSGWREDAGETGSVQYRNGKYQVRITQRNYMWWSWSPCEVVPDNFIVEVTGYARAASLYSYYGVVWGVDNDNLLALLMTPTGWFTVLSLRDSKWQTSPIDWKESGAIDTGENESNTLRVTVEGGTVEVHINNRRVGGFETGRTLDLAAAFSSPTAVDLSEGETWLVGIAGGSFDKVPVEFYFDSFALYELPEGDAQGPPTINVGP